MDQSQAVTPLVETFEVFYLREYRSVLAIANVLIGNHAAAEDLTQDVFLAAYRTWGGIESPERWVRSAVTKQSMSWWRRSFTSRRALANLHEPEAPIADMQADTEEFWDLVRRLPRRQAQAIVLFYLEDRPTEEIGDILGCDPSTVRIHLSRGRRTLANWLGAVE